MAAESDVPGPGVADVDRSAASERCAFDVTVAIDFGTHGTAYAVAFPPANPADLSSMAREVIPIKPGEAAGSADKQLTAVLVSAKEPHKLIKFGNAARELLAELTDNPDERVEPAFFFQAFKMRLSPDGARKGALNRITVNAMGRTHPAPEGSTSKESAVPALLLVQRSLEFVRDDAMAFLRARMRATDVEKLRIMWVLTVPAIWDDKAKGFMREAAFAAGLIATEDAPNLMLALEPEAAVLASIAECASVDRPRFEAGRRLMVVDCGGGTVDITVNEVVEAASPGPLALREIAPPSGGPWGATMVDRNFNNLLREVLGDLYKHLHQGTRLELLQQWEDEKRRVTGAAGEEEDRVSVRTNELISNLNDWAADVGALSGFTRLDLEELVAAYNAREGLEGERALQLSKAKKLSIPAHLVQRLFHEVIGRIVEHVRRLLAEVGAIDSIMLVGGFAESRILQRTLKAEFETAETAVVVPARPGKVVVTGAALFALQPRAIQSRIMRWTYAYVGAERFNPDLHDEEWVYEVEGRERVDVLFPLVQKGDTVPVGQVCTRAGLVPVRDDQEVVEFELFRIDQRIVDPRNPADAHQPRWVVVDELSEDAFNPEILERDRCGSLTVPIGNLGRPRNERKVDLALRFGSTEVTASAVNLAGESQSCAFRYK